MPAGTDPPIGAFSFDVRDGVWMWDDEVYRIHGLPAQSKSPDTDDALACVKDRDRVRIAAVLVRAQSTSDHGSVTYSLAGADGVERKVLMICRGGAREGDAVVSVEGYYIDLTEDFRHEAQQLVSTAVAEASASRAVIEQAKGGLMLAYGLDAERAFAMLRWWSSSRNVKVRDLAGRLVRIIQSGGAARGDMRRDLDTLLHDLTVPSSWAPGGAAPDAPPGD